MIVTTGSLAGLKISDDKVQEDWLGLGDTPEPFKPRTGSDTIDDSAKAFLDRLAPKFRDASRHAPLRSVQEVEAYRYALTPLIGQHKAATLACYLGGESGTKGAFDGESYLNDVTTMQSECVTMGKGGAILTPEADRNPGNALNALKQVSPWAHKWVRDKVYAKAVSKETSLNTNVDQEVAEFYKNAARNIKAGVSSALNTTPYLVVGGVALFLLLRSGGRRK